MSYDLWLAERIRNYLKDKSIPAIEKKMMGGLCFMVNDKMCCGVVKNELMVRIAPESYEELLKKQGSRPMDFTGKPMRGFLFVENMGIDMEEDLAFWIDKCLAYNPIAKSSKKKS